MTCNQDSIMHGTHRISVVLSIRMKLALVVVACGWALGPGVGCAAGKKASSKSDAARPAVDRVLRPEVAGPVDRLDLLAGALREHAGSPLVRWQAGFVRDGKSWRAFDESPAAGPATAALTEYQSRRRTASETFADQLLI